MTTHTPSININDSVELYLYPCYRVNFILLYFTVFINTRTVYDVHSAVSSPELKDNHHMTTKLFIHTFSFSEAL
jgi:hypothetical protein